MITPASTLDPSQLDTLARLLEADGHQLAGPLQSTLMSGGRSNLTYRVTDGDHDWVLRRPPRGHVLETAHDMGREYSVMKALAATKIPVPATTLFHESSDALGTPFYVMDLVRGSVLRNSADLRNMREDDAATVSRAFIDSLAELHLVDPRSVNLQDLGKAEGYLGRQLRRWARQLSSAGHRDASELRNLGEKLARHVPDSRHASIVHGDYRLDNVIVDMRDPGRIGAILDWEMATLGDPLADLGLTWLYWEGWSGIPNPIAGTPSEHAGFEPWDRLAARYEKTTGINLTNFRWYQAFAIYKFAVIAEGIDYRHAQGDTIGDGFDTIGAMVPELVRRGTALALAL